MLSLALAVEKLFGPMAPPPTVAGCSGCTANTRNVPVAFNGTGQPNATAAWSYFGLTFNGTCNRSFLTTYGQQGATTSCGHANRATAQCWAPRSSLLEGSMGRAQASVWLVMPWARPLLFLASAPPPDLCLFLACVSIVITACDAGILGIGTSNLNNTLAANSTLSAAG